MRYAEQQRVWLYGHKCQKPNHFAAKYHSKTKIICKHIRALESDDPDEVFPVNVSAVQLDDSQLVMLKLESDNYLHFQVDTGAQCNVIPLSLYKKATRDYKLEYLTPVDTTITAYGGTTLSVVGRALVRVWCGDFRCKLDCKLVDVNYIRPLLGRKACLGMKIISYQLDNDKIHRPNTTDAVMFTLEIQRYTSREQLIEQHPNVSGHGVGKLEGECHIHLNKDVTPIQHSPRRVPVALWDRLKETLDSLVAQHIIVQVTQLTPWINSMVVVPKKDGTFRICLDPKDLYCAIQREHYQLTNIEDIATRLHGAKVFTILDVHCGFWHVPLAEHSSLLTTFHTRPLADIIG